MLSVILTLEEYESLISLAKNGVLGDSAKTIELDQWLQGIEKRNGVTRYFLMVQWQEVGLPLPPGVRFPEQWPVSTRKNIELTTRPIARSDVDSVLTQYATNPVTVLVTTDPNGIVGWIPVDDYFTYLGSRV